jgi:putative nucleotidyltransferase with HDIG domain
MLRDAALAILRTESPYGVALENHCLRLAELSLALAEQRAIALDEDLIRAGCLLHDIGLCVKNPRQRNYLERGLAFVEPRMDEWGLAEEPRAILRDVMLYNHSLRSVPGISPAADAVRLAVQVEHSLGRISHGLPPAVCRAVFARYPRHDFNRVLLEFFKIVVREDGPSELLRIFLPTGLLSPLGRG